MSGKLTEAQRAALEQMAKAEFFGTYAGRSWRTFRTLKTLTFAKYLGTGMWEITPAGRAALQAQEGMT